MTSSLSKLSKINFQAGFHRDTTQYDSEGRWYAGDKVRFYKGRPQNIRGYAKFITTDLDGNPRDIHSWNSNTTEKYLATGTEQKLYLIDTDILYDITPIITVVSISAGTNGSFDTSIGSPLIRVSLTNHNVSVRDWILFTSSSINGFGAATEFGTSAFGGPAFQCVSLEDANHFYISTTSVAASTETNMGQATLNYYLQSENTVNIQGLGYGAGVYNAGVSITGERAWNDPADSSSIILEANQWTLDNWGEDLLAVRKGGPLIHWDANASTIPTRSSVVPTSPSQINTFVISPNDRHVILLGTNEYATSAYNPLLVRWSNQEDYTDYTPSISSTSGEIQLIDGTKIVGGIRGRNAVHIWTDKAMYGLSYQGPPYIFNNTLLGDNCGLVGPHAAINLNGISFWMSQDNFYAFTGRVEKLQCTFNTDLFETLNTSQSDKVYAGVNNEFNEVIWLIPSGTSDEPSKYVIYNPSENHWTDGTGFFTTYEGESVFDVCKVTGRVSAAADMFVWDFEPVSVYTGDGVGIPSYVESAYFDIDEGDNLMYINRIIPDYHIDNGEVKITIDTKRYPNGTTITKGPYTIDSNTNKIDFRARGRQAAIRVSCDTSGTEWRAGASRIQLQPDGER